MSFFGPRRFRKIIQIQAAVFLVLANLAACSPSPGLGDLDRVLQTSWRSYVQRYISPEGRVVLSERGGESISEAQAYALMRALWAGDEATFTRVYAWTQENLSRRETQGDHLLAWHWGKRPDGSLGVLDWNTAADADLDYAMALLLAARRGWRPSPPLADYSEQAQRTAADIIAKEVVVLPTNEVLLAPGNWREAAPPFLINPSYFSPAAYRLFAQARFGVSWNLLDTLVYPFLEHLGRNLHNIQGVGIFPDWVEVEATGLFRPFPGRDTNFGWEAVRLPWRLALDRLWFGEERADKLLSRDFLPFFRQEWQNRGKLPAVYSYEGKPLVNYESPVLYAGVLGAALAAGDREFAREMAGKILSFYREEGGEAYFVSPDNYYANNWAWLGLALYAGWVRNF